MKTYRSLNLGIILNIFMLGYAHSNLNLLDFSWATIVKNIECKNQKQNSQHDIIFEYSWHDMVDLGYEYVLNDPTSALLDRWCGEIKLLMYNMWYNIQKLKEFIEPDHEAKVIMSAAHCVRDKCLLISRYFYYLWLTCLLFQFRAFTCFQIPMSLGCFA